MPPRRGKRIDHAEVPIVPSPSGLPTQHLVAARDGAAALFVGQQWLQPGDQVLPHSHPVEEALVFLAGEGEATLGDERVPIGAGVSLYVPSGLVHGFRCTGTHELHVIVIFPEPRFAETTFEETDQGTATIVGTTGWVASVIDRLLRKGDDGAADRVRTGVANHGMGR